MPRARFRWLVDPGARCLVPALPVAQVYWGESTSFVRMPHSSSSQRRALSAKKTKAATASEDVDAALALSMAPTSAPLTSVTSLG